MAYMIIHGRKPIPYELDAFRASLGDAGIPHTLLYSKNGWPYIKFDAPSITQGWVSVQYCKARKKHETGEVCPAHYLAFIPSDDGPQPTNSNWRTHVTRSFKEEVELRTFLGTTEADLARGRENGRSSMPFHERVTSVVHPMIEQSYLAAMRR